MTFVESLAALIEKHFGGSEKPPVTEVTKSLDKEQRMALFVVLEPQEGDMTTDLHGDTYTAEEVEKACHSFNKHCQTANLFHHVVTQDADIVQSYVTLSDLTLDNGRFIKKGSWVQWWHFPEGNAQADLMWEGVKSGEINGVSIGAMARVEDIQ